jgi:mannose-1-phosphate guanylyltransferase
MISDLQVVPKVWGSEQWIVNGDRYCGKLLLLMRGWQCSLHRHVVKDETFFVLSGRVRMELGVETFELAQGQSTHVPPGALHRFAGLTDAEIIEISTHHDDADVVRIEPSRRMG